MSPTVHSLLAPWHLILEHFCQLPHVPHKQTLAIPCKIGGYRVTYEICFAQLDEERSAVSIRSSANNQSYTCATLLLHFPTRCQNTPPRSLITATFSRWGNVLWHAHGNNNNLEIMSTMPQCVIEWRRITVWLHSRARRLACDCGSCAYTLEHWCFRAVSHGCNSHRLILRLDHVLRRQNLRGNFSLSSSHLVMTKKQSRAQGVLKARQRKEVKVQASSSYSSSHSARIFTPGSSPKLETPSPQTQDGFHATAGHLPDLHFLDVFDVASSNNTSFLNHDATDELSDFIASPLLYSLNSFENSPYIDVRLSLSPEQSPQTYNSLAMSWTQIPPFGRSPSSDRGRSSSQNIPVTTSSDNIYHGSPQVMVSPSYEQYPTQNANNVYDYAPVEGK